MKNIQTGSFKMSQIVLGTCYFGEQISIDTSYALMDKYYELGGRTLDTARCYHGMVNGRDVFSEQIVGDWIRSRGVRSSVLLVTKGGCPTPRLSEPLLREDLEASLDALGYTPDIYLLHRDDRSVPAGELADRLDSFVREGKTAAVGVSNWAADRIVDANEYISAHNLSKLCVSQIQWSLAVTDAALYGDETLAYMDDRQREFYAQSGMPIMAFSSQAKGFFSKYIAGGRAALSEKSRTRFGCEQNYLRAERVRELSRNYGTSPAAVALAYILCSGLNSAAVVGCSNVAQLVDSMAAADLELAADEILQLELK